MSEYDKPKNTMELLIDCYHGVNQPINEEVVKEPTISSEGTETNIKKDNEPSILGLLQEVTNTRQGLRNTANEISKAPKNAQQSLFEKYKIVNRALLEFEEEIQNLLN